VIENDYKLIKINKLKITRVASFIFEEAKPKQHWNINIIFTDDGTMRRLNFQFLKSKATTDVIAFDLSDKDTTGEIYINLERIPQQARDYHVSAENEVMRLVAHGLYHLLGYEDRTKHQRAFMTRLEDRVLQHFSL